MAKTPAFTFLFPYRWITDDKEFFAENIHRQTSRFVTNDDKKILEDILRYRVIMVCRYNKPLKINVTKATIEKALKQLFPNAKCLSCDIEYEQVKSSSLLPVIDFQLYL